MMTTGSAVTEDKAREVQVTPLRRRAINSAAWAIFGQVAQQGLRFIGNIALAWSLGPAARAAYGLMSLVNIYVNGLAMLTDVGIAPGVIQSKRGDDPKFLNTAWTMQLFRGAAITVLAAIMGFPLAWIYDEPYFAVLMPFAAIATLIGSARSTRGITARRHLAIGRITICRIAARVVALFVGVTWAFFWPSVWALVAMAIASSLVLTVLTHTVLPGVRNRLGWDKESARDLISFGRWVMISSIIMFLAMQADRMILGGLFDIEMLGIFSVALMISRVPRDLVTAISSSAIFPAVSRSVDLPRPQLREKILRNRRPILMVMAVVVATMGVFGDFAVEILYPKEFAPGAWMLPVLVLGLWPRILDTTISESLIALRKLQYNAAGSVSRLILVVGMLPLGFYWYGVAGAVIVVALAECPKYLIHGYGLGREKLLGAWQDVWTTLFAVGLVLAMLAIRYAIGYGTPFDGIGEFAHAAHAMN